MAAQTTAVITPPPGIITNGTELSKRGRWIDGDLVRWVDGKAKPIGGWERMAIEKLDGDPIKSFAYITNGGIRVLILGTSEKVYYYDGTLRDITPTGFVTPASASNTGDGYGTGAYGGGDYGTPRSDSGLMPAIYQYYFGSWGEHLIFCCNSDGKIYRYIPGDTRATQITGSPTQCAGLVVTDQRMIVAFGCGGKYNRVEWCDREDYTVWTTLETNLAGGLNVNTSSPLIDAVNWRGEIVLFTKSDLHVMSYVGYPNAYGVQKVSDYSPPISPRAVIATSRSITWIAKGGLYQFDGGIVPIDCPVWETLSENVNVVTMGKICAGHNSFNDEMWFFFPETGEASPNRGMVWNYRENLWGFISIGRTTWLDAGVWPFPITTDGSGYVIQHEHVALSSSYELGSRIPFLESAPNDVAYGQNLIEVRRIIPDEQFQAAEQLSYTLIGKMYPGQPERSFGPYQMNSHGTIDTRATARQFKIRIEAPSISNFVIGEMKAMVMSRGER